MKIQTRGKGVKKCETFADVICTWPLACSSILSSPVEPTFHFPLLDPSHSCSSSSSLQFYCSHAVFSFRYTQRFKRPCPDPRAVPSCVFYDSRCTCQCLKGEEHCAKTAGALLTAFLFALTMVPRMHVKGKSPSIDLL